MNKDWITLEFDKIIQRLQEQAVSQSARRRLAETAPILNEGLCRARMEETTAARTVLENAGTPPLAETEGTEESLLQAVQGGMLGEAVPPLTLALFVAGAKRGAIVYHERA